MKLKEFVENLNKLMENRPETAEYDVIISVDEEGNSYRLVYCNPAVGFFDKEDRDFYRERKVNAVCVN